MKESFSSCEAVAGQYGINSILQTLQAVISLNSRFLGGGKLCFHFLLPPKRRKNSVEDADYSGYRI
jgi:hypothetical protein